MDFFLAVRFVCARKDGTFATNDVVVEDVASIIIIISVHLCEEVSYQLSVTTISVTAQCTLHCSAGIDQTRSNGERTSVCLSALSARGRMDMPPLARGWARREAAES